ncbi:hypothetical protein BB561_004934 [Smittium simulii]|uniref:Uncharacterized protein n=1 Tax=Smittium simulii TaxID=133385 RepID=A0A2T9YD99_9FUNG|nr:hypothetical protein BB561_004934 [Smittium simulii]
MAFLTYKTIEDKWEENYNSALDILSIYKTDKQKTDLEKKNLNNASALNLAHKNKKNSENLSASNKLYPKFEPYKKICADTSNKSIKETKSFDDQPLPRFAMEIVFSQKLCAQFMFGGNPNSSRNFVNKSCIDQKQDAFENNPRLCDLWSLKLNKPSVSTMIRKCTYLVRTLKYLHMCVDLLYKPLFGDVDSNHSETSNSNINNNESIFLSNTNNGKLYTFSDLPQNISSMNSAKTGMAMCANMGVKSNDTANNEFKTDLTLIDTAGSEYELKPVVKLLDYLKKNISVFVDFNDSSENEHYKSLVQVLYLSKEEFPNFLKSEFDIGISVNHYAFNFNPIALKPEITQTLSGSALDIIMKKARLDLFVKIQKFITDVDSQKTDDLGDMGIPYKSFKT